MTIEELKEEKPWIKRGTVVFMSDFGTVDGAVSAMHGVADEVDHHLRLEDLTHEIPQFNIWEASYRLIQAILINNQDLIRRDQEAIPKENSQATEESGAFIRGAAYYGGGDPDAE